VARWSGRPGTFLAAVALVLVWIATGPLFDWNETWQLFINTSTTIVTFLMIFLLQSTQNRDAEAVQLKLDELIRVLDRASNSMLSIEELDEEDLDRLKLRYEALARRSSALGAADPESPEEAGEGGGETRPRPS
jgi:low affinity Fe/Cu permease